MKWLLVILLFLSYFLVSSTKPPSKIIHSIYDTVPTGAAPQLFGGKLYEFKNYVLVDSFLMIRGGDTFAIPRWPAIKFKSSDRNWYANDSMRWRPLQYANTQDLQATTDIGNKTTDTIIGMGLRTQNILSDTINEANFEFDIFGDIQKLTWDGNPTRKAILYSQFDWVKNNVNTENIKAVLQVGDITDNNYDSEYLNADTAFKKIESVNIPIMAVIGNHDYVWMTRDSTRYNQYFGPSRFAGRSYYGGNYNGSNTNYYIKFDVGKHKFLALGLEFMPQDSSIAWGQRVLDSFPDRETIVVTHGYITHFGEKSADSSFFSASAANVVGNSGQSLWDKLIKKNKQIFLVVAGHFIETTFVPVTPSVQRIIQTGLNGNTVNQFLVNYQSDTSGGNGYFMRMKFKPLVGKIDISIYSPYTGHNDTRYPPYSIDYPVIRTEATVGVSNRLNVAGQVRFDSTVFITQIPKNRIIVSDTTGKIDSIPYELPNKVLASPASGVVAGDITVRSLVVNDIPLDSGKNVLNQLTYPQTGNYWLKGKGVVTGFNAYRSGLIGGAPATLYVAHGGGNYGLSIQRATAGTGGANLAFYHTTSTSPDLAYPSSSGDNIGAISWQGVAADSSITLAAQQTAFVYKIGSNYVSSGMRWFTVDTNGVLGDRMNLSSTGDLRLGGTSSTLYKLHIQSGNAYIAGNTYTIGNVGIGTTSPTARLHLPAGTSAANTAPLKFTTGTNLTTPEDGVVEYDGVHYYGTIGSTRYQLDQQITATPTWDAVLTAGPDFSTAHTSALAANTWTITASQTSTAGVNINNTGNGSALAISSSGTGAAGSASNSSSGNGWNASSSSGNGINATSTTGQAGRFKITPSSTNTSVTVAKFIRGSSGTMAAGGGGNIDIAMTDDAGNDITASSVRSVWVSAATGSTSSELQLWNINSGSLNKHLTLKNTGQQQNHLYGSGTFTGTAAYNAQFDASGNVIEGPVNLTNTATLDFPNTTAGTSSDLTITVTGAADGDVVAIGVPNASTVANGCFTAWVSASNTVTVRFTNNDLTNAYNPASGTFKATIIKQ